MAFEFKLPDIGEGLTEGEVVKWLVAVGDTVVEDQPMVEVMTDKATVEITAPTAGVIAEIRAQEGQTVPVGSVMVVIDNAKGGAAPAAKPAAKPAAAKADPAPEAEDSATPAAQADPAPEVEASAEPAAPATPAPAAQASPAPAAQASPAPAAQASPAPAARTIQAPAARTIQAPAAHASLPAAARPTAVLRERTLAAPATRKRAREMGLNLDAIPGTGEHGRVTRADVEAFASLDRAPAADAASAKAPALPDEPAAPRAALPALAPAAGRADRRVPLRGLRARIAEQMVRSKQFSPHFTFAEECDMTNLVALRSAGKETAESYGLKLTYLPFIMKALVHCFRRFPELNAVVDDTRNEYVVRGEVNIGLATDTEEGLTVVVVKNCEQRSVLQIAQEIERLTTAARSRKIAMEDIKGSTFTITSAGSIGGIMATPILNYPEVGILGVYKIAERAVVREGQIVIRKMANFTITLDHRIVDGATAARFMNELVRLLEAPALMLLES